MLLATRQLVTPLKNKGQSFHFCQTCLPESLSKIEQQLWPCFFFTLFVNYFLVVAEELWKARLSL